MKLLTDQQHFFFELSMATGISTDPLINCRSFTDTLISGGINYAGFWMKDEETGEQTQMYASGDRHNEMCPTELMMLDSACRDWHTNSVCSTKPYDCPSGMSVHLIRVNSSVTLFMCSNPGVVDEEFLRDFKRVVNKLGISLYGAVALSKLNEEVKARKKAEKILMDNNRRFSEVLNGTQDGTWDWDMTTNQVFYSEFWAQMLGYEPNELTNDIKCWSEKVHPEDLKKTMCLIDAHLKGKSDIYVSEHRLLTKSGEYKWILDRGKAVRDHSGKIIRMVGTHQDIDYRKKLELKLNQLNENLEFLVKERTKQLSVANDKLKTEIKQRETAESELRLRVKELEEAYEQIKAAQSAMVRQEKLASIGQLASGVAHELNNPFGFITSNFHVLNTYFKNFAEFLDELNSAADSEYGSATASGLPELLTKYNITYSIEDSMAIFSESEEGFRRISVIVDNLLAFARSDSGKKRIFNISSAIMSTLAVARSEIKYVANIKDDIGVVPDSEFNVGEFNQVILNILLNSLYAIKSQKRSDQGIISIKTSSDGQYIYVDITDDGPGIPPHIQDRVFDAFFTTKPVGDGTGLGLNIAYDIIVNRHKGKLELTSEPGMTQFSIAVPIV